jgi:LuxR family maltose regulon positive regulatory protein
MALQLVYAFKKGDANTAVELARRTIEFDVDDAPQARSAARVTYGAALYFAGSVDEARAVLQQAVQLAEQVGDRRHRVYAVGYLALIAAEAGQLESAEHEIRRATGVGTDPIGSEHFIDAVVALAVAIVLDVRGDRAAAADVAALAVGLARKSAGILELAKALSIRAKLLTDLGDEESAAVNRNEANTLLRGCADVAIPRTTFARAGQGGGVAVTARDDVWAVPEELTSKELEVLRLLATRLSRREIGQRLYVSLNTVKTHQRALYRKLGVDSRQAAVARARELGLL